MSRRWQVYKRGENLLEHLLALRQIDPDKILPSYEDDLHSPWLLPDMEKAAELIAEAIKSRWPIAVVGDYDVDGTLASALLDETFRYLGGSCQVFLPKRSDGYGLSEKIVRQAAAGSKLLITVDNGITAVDEVALANSLGLKVIVIDHHLPGAQLPPAEAIVCPYLPDSIYPFKHLCGCALAYKTIVALEKYFPSIDEGYKKWLLDLVAIATVSDVMPLTGENRTLVHYGLKVLERTRRPGLKALLDTAKIDADKLNAASIGFVLGPRLNASGRLGDNWSAFELVTSLQPAQALEKARQLERNNASRQNLLERALEQAEELTWRQNSSKDRLLTLVNNDWAVGILGLIAGRLSEAHHRPVLVASAKQDALVGSGRSIENYSLVDSLRHASKHLDRWGGHRLAAGFALRRQFWGDFTASVKEHAAATMKELPQKTLRLEAELRHGEVNLTTAKQLETLQPHGFGNPKPLFLLRNVRLYGLRPLGGGGKHFRAQAKFGNFDFDVVAFNFSKEAFTDFQGVPQAALAGYLENNRYLGRVNLQFQLKDLQGEPAEIETVDPK